MEYEEILTRKEASFWLETSPKTNFPILREDLKVHVIVLGGVLRVLQLQRYLKNPGLLWLLLNLIGL